MPSLSLQPSFPTSRTSASLNRPASLLSRSVFLLLLFAASPPCSLWLSSCKCWQGTRLSPRHWLHRLSICSPASPAACRSRCERGEAGKHRIMQGVVGDNVIHLEGPWSCLNAQDLITLLGKECLLYICSFMERKRKKGRKYLFS